MLALKVQKNQYKRFTLDISNAFLRVSVVEPCIVQPPQEWVDEFVRLGGCPDVVCELTRELSGKRVAPSGWANFVAQVLKVLGLEQHHATPWIFTDLSREFFLEVHMGCAPSDSVIEGFIRKLSGNAMVKDYFIHRTGEACGRLKRRFEIYNDRCFVSPNPRYYDKLGKVVELNDSRVSPTPGTKPTDEELAQAVPWAGADITKFRSCVGVLLYMCLDRSDIQDTVRRLSPGMKSPTTFGWECVKKVVRYLRLTRDYKIALPTKEDTKVLEAFSDASFANDRLARRSVSSGLHVWWRRFLLLFEGACGSVHLQCEGGALCGDGYRLGVHIHAQRVDLLGQPGRH